MEEKILKHNLRVTKQLILLLELKPEDFGLTYPVPKGILHYLFGTLPESAGRANIYLHTVNVIYSLLRDKLSKMAQRGKLSAKQTISAKKIIHNLNKESVTAMVHLLKLNDTAMPPEDLIALIKMKRTDGNLDPRVETQIKEVVYFKKLRVNKTSMPHLEVPL